MSDSASVTPPAIIKWRIGVGLVLLATLCLSLQNVLVKIAQSKEPLEILGGLLKLGGYVTANPQNPLQVPLLVLLIRISFVAPLLWVILPLLKRDAWQEARQTLLSDDNGLKFRILAAGVALFCSQMGIYLAIPRVGPPTAITLFFIYPTVTTLLAWFFFSERPTWKQWLAIAFIYVGCIWLTFSGTSAIFKTEPVGILFALLSGVVFAIEGILAQSCFGKVSPPTFTGMVFTIELAVLWITALLLGIQIAPNLGLMLMGLLLCLATMSGYLFNNAGIRAIGAASTSIIGSSGPAVTALLNLLILQDMLNLSQWLSIGIVTIGIVLMNIAKAQRVTA